MNRRKFLKLIPTSAGTAIVASKVDAASIIPNPKPWCEEDDITDFIKFANGWMTNQGHSRTDHAKLLKIRLKDKERVPES